VPDRYRSIAPADGWMLAAANSAKRAPHAGDVSRLLPPLVAAVERAHDELPEVLVLGDAMAVDEEQFDRDVVEGLTRIDVEEERLVEDCN